MYNNNVYEARAHLYLIVGASDCTFKCYLILHDRDSRLKPGKDFLRVNRLTNEWTRQPFSGETLKS